MKRPLKIIAAAAFMALILSGCDGVEYVEVPRVEPVFSEEAQKWGELFAESLTNAAKEVRNQKIKQNDKDAVFQVSQEATLDAFEEGGLITSDEKTSFDKGTEVDVSVNRVSLAQALESEELSRIQKNVLERIEEARLKSRSYIEFTNKLATINNEIPMIVPKEEQALLYSVTSTLYYGLEAIEGLVEKALLPGRPEKGVVTLASLKFGLQSATAHGEEDGCGGWWSCWGKCAAGIIGGAGTGALVGCGVATIGCGAGAIIGGIFGALVGAAASCDSAFS